jgi:Ser/Thr protein kinase RdoA (MazF antagonist)
MSCAGDAAASAARAALAAWAVAGDVAIVPLAGGHINDSFRVTAPDPDQPGAHRRLLLQRLNGHVFPRPVQVMENVALVTARLEAAVAERELDWRVPSLLPTPSGTLWHVDAAGGCWRLVPWLDGVVTREAPRSAVEAREAARAYGDLLCVLAGDEPDGTPMHRRLHITLPGFHDTAFRLEALERAVEGARSAAPGAAAMRLQEVADVLRVVRAHARLAGVLPPLLASGEVPIRAVHNDAKMSNVLLDVASGRAVSVVDLDTVMPGTALYDFGDMVRSMSCRATEDAAGQMDAEVDVAFLQAVKRGYLEAAGAMLTPTERRLLPIAGQIITLEQAARFLTDHLQGDQYYRVAYPGQNLSRARTQVALLEKLEHREPLD